MFYAQIYDYAKSLGISIDEYNVFVNAEQVFKGYATRLYSGRKTHDEIKAIKFKDFYDENKKLIAWMWYGLSSLNGQIKAQGNIQRGLRLRKGNIQIGESGTLRRLFKDPRGNEYYMGEVFAVHPHLIPNARRDYFNDNVIRDTFEKQLREFLEFLWKLCNVASDERSAYRSIEDYRKSFKEYTEKTKTGFSGGVDRETMQIALEEKLLKAKKGQRMIQKSIESTDDPITAQIKKIVATAEITNTLEPLKPLPEISIEEEKVECRKKTKPVYITDELSQFPKETRRVVGRIYDMINQNAPDIARNLIEKIHAGLKAAKKD
jgi:molecular chaperone HtpG